MYRKEKPRIPSGQTFILFIKRQRKKMLISVLRARYKTFLFPFLPIFFRFVVKEKTEIREKERKIKKTWSIKFGSF